MDLSLTLKINHTADGRFRATVSGHPASAVEADNLEGLLEAMRPAILRALEDEEDLRDSEAALRDAEVNGTIPWEKATALIREGR